MLNKTVTDSTHESWNKQKIFAIFDAFLETGLFRIMDGKTIEELKSENWGMEDGKNFNANFKHIPSENYNYVFSSNDKRYLYRGNTKITISDIKNIYSFYNEKNFFFYLCHNGYHYIHLNMFNGTEFKIFTANYSYTNKTPWFLFTKDIYESSFNDGSLIKMPCFIVENYGSSINRIVKSNSINGINMFLGASILKPYIKFKFKGKTYFHLTYGLAVELNE